MNIFTLPFWFELQQTALVPQYNRAFFLIFAGMLVLSTIVRIVRRKWQKRDKYLARGFDRFANLLFAQGIFGLVLLWFNYEELYLLGARFWFLIWAILGLIWFGSIVRYIVKTAPELREKAEARGEVNKYLPRRNA